jgi:hypothetical protein
VICDEGIFHGLISIGEQIPARQRANRQHTHSPVEALTLRWFADMRQGRINRSELTPEYDAH